LLDRRWLAGLSDVERMATELVVDLDAAETTCPACLTPFAPSAARCPSCGLRFG
jgi:predicted amidophosphoribosyltransferase